MRVFQENKVGCCKWSKTDRVWSRVVDLEWVYRDIRREEISGSLKVEVLSDSACS